jgi:hypothetical protein
MATERNREILQLLARCGRRMPSDLLVCPEDVRQKGS